MRARDTDDVTLTSQSIYIMTAESTVLALNKVHEDDLDKKILAAARLIAIVDQSAMPLLTNPNVEINHVIEQGLLEILPEEYRGLMAAAYETFNLHYEFPATSEVLVEPYVTYLRAFLKGIRDGAERVLDLNNATLSISVDLHLEEE
jgi:hypothetical protein